jgi:hypothetical protein
MCLIVVKEAGIKLPDKEHLENGAYSNRDGIGVAWHKKGVDEILIKKDFVNVFVLNKWIEENVKVEDSLIVHFRFGTSGLKDAGNAHPYPLVKDETLLRNTQLVWQNAVAHNGVFRSYGNDKILNDTQEFIIDILSEEVIKNNLKSPAIQKLIKEYISTNKLAFMLNNGEIILLGDFNEEKGVKFSNYAFKWGNFKNKTFGSGLTKPYQSGHDYTNAYQYCENCQIMRQDVKDIWHKKVKLNLCRECRKELASGKLDKLIEKKKNIEASTNINTENIEQDKCGTCNKMLDRIYLNYDTTDSITKDIIWICDDCKKIKDNENKCPMCDKPTKLTDLIPYQGLKQKICIECVRELTLKGNVKGVAGSENGGLLLPLDIKTGLN